MNVLALDLSLTASGAALPDGELLTLAPRGLTGPERLDWIEREVAALVAATMPDLVAVEGYAFGRPNQATAIGELGGVIRLALWRRGLTLAEVPPTSVKKYATGRGNATKPDLRMALFQRTGIDEPDDNRVDAAWLRFMALDQYGAPELDMPKANREALARVAWPAGGGGR